MVSKSLFYFITNSNVYMWKCLRWWTLKLFSPFDQVCSNFMGSRIDQCGRLTVFHWSDPCLVLRKQLGRQVLHTCRSYFSIFKFYENHRMLYQSLIYTKGKGRRDCYLCICLEMTLFKQKISFHIWSVLKAKNICIVSSREKTLRE